MALAIIDTNVILAGINVRDSQHQRCRRLLERGEFRLIVPALCIAEVSHLVNRDLGAEVEAGFLASLESLEVASPEESDWSRIRELVSVYRSFPLGTVDASIVVLAERLRISTILTMDHRHFRAIRPTHVEAFTLLPER